MKKRLISALLAVTALISTGMCIGCTDAAIDTSSSKVEKEQELTDAEKKAILRGEFSKYFQNDLREILPFSDIIGLPLADLKTAVDTSNNWAVETSVHVNHVKDDEIVYSFSNRELHIQDSDSNSFVSYIAGGAVNAASVKLEAADYVDIVTDNTAQQRVTTVYITKRNSGTTFDEMKEVLASKYKIDEQDSTDELIVIYGLISEPDYTGIYDYTHGLTTVKPTNTGFGCLTFNMTDECVIFKIYETIQLV